MPIENRRCVSIACFGEALWDILPRGIFLGGAPLNVAYHLSRLGVQAWPVSAVGRDFLGTEAVRRIAGWGLDTGLVASRKKDPTGTVRAALDARGVATYRIETGVAWDRIDVSRTRRIPAPAALVFGTLALRSAANRAALEKLLAAWPTAWRVLDLNLRPPHHVGPGVALALRHAQFVKLNDDELARMTATAVKTSAQTERAARRFAAAHGLARVCVTAGARGAGLLWDETWSWEPARPVAVRDTIGAGDAFLAGFLATWLAGTNSPSAALGRACRLGEFVASRDGATPPYRLNVLHRPVDEKTTRR